MEANLSQILRYAIDQEIPGVEVDWRQQVHHQYANLALREQHRAAIKGWWSLRYIKIRQAKKKLQYQRIFEQPARLLRQAPLLRQNLRPEPLPEPAQ